MIIVTCEDQTLPTHQREDEYPAAAKWDVDAHGGLRIEDEKGSGVAAYPSGRWLRVRKSEPETAC